MKTFIAALVTAAALPAFAADTPGCRLAQIAVWPVRLLGNQPVVEGSLNGQKAGIMLDTGAYTSMITKDAAQRLDLYTRATGEIAQGVGGESRVLMTRVRELRIADATVENMRVRVVGERPMRGIDFILGEDFFRKVDLEFDYAKGRVGVFQPSAGCEKSWLAYWDPNAAQVPFDSRVSHILLPMKVNGREAIAMLDSGASSSVVSLQLAEKLGITSKSPGVVPASCMFGIGADVMTTWVAPFETLSIGGETIRDAHLKIMDLGRISYGSTGADLVLGTDFLRTHRVLISRLQDKVYFSYVGGQVFPHTASLDCDERLVGKSPEEARAALDKAIAEDPRDLRARLSRGALRASQKDPKGAIVDLDAALAMEPNNAVALRLRMAARAALEDYDGALADADAAIANGMRVADLFARRAMLHEGKGDLAAALQDAGEALALDPRHPLALSLHGRYLFHAGRFEEAEKDFEARLAQRQSAFDPLWIFISRARRGADGKPVLEEALAKAKGEAWPAPLMQFLLGRLDREALFTAAAAEEKTRAGRQCEARFYVAESLIASGRRAEARPLLEQARAECPRDFVEYKAAAAELRTQ